MEAVILIGIQATGKSTFYLAQFFKTHVRINLDMLKTRHREDILLEACIHARQSFVVDNTNATRAERAKYISLAKGAGFQTVGYYFRSHLDEALRRNRQRSGKEFIPEKGVAARHNQLQIPEYSEGFDQLYYVRIDPSSSQFVVEAWNKEP